MNLNCSVLFPILCFYVVVFVTLNNNANLYLKHNREIPKTLKIFFLIPETKKLYRIIIVIRGTRHDGKNIRNIV